jgi:DNA mismatch endonuclease (patch repair protein)
MRNLRHRGSFAEQCLRSRIHSLGFRFRKDYRPVTELRCAADLVFRRQLVCVFFDGCFWHGCPRHFRVPRSNSAWWLEKIEDNRARDKRQTRQLRTRGWTVVRVWEHEPIERAAGRIVKALGTTS